MIVYQALSTYQILECIEHRKCFHSKEEAVLILGTYIMEKFPHYRKISEYNLFDEVFLFDFGNVSPEENQVIEAMEVRLKRTLPFNLSDVDKIYIAGIHTYLSVYLIAKNIEFSMFEDGSGALSRPWVLAEITKKSNPKKYELINKYGLYEHSSDLIVEKWCNQKTQLENFHDNKSYHFDVVEGFQKLEEKEQQHLLEFFGVNEKISVPEDSILILTQQFSNLGQLSFEEHIEIYQNLLDFYLNAENEKIILKLHPDDILYYKKLFPGICVVREMFPSELLPYVFDKIPNKIVTISSTGIHLIRDKFKEHIEFNALYEKTFIQDPVYYTAIELLKIISAANVDCHGLNQIQFDNMFRCCTENKLSETIYKTNNNSGNVLIIDDYDESKSEIQEDLYDAVIYLNSEKEYKQYELGGKEIFSRLMPIEISVNYTNGIEKQFMIWLQPNTEEIKKMTENFKIEQDLKNTGAILKARTFSKEELEIMRLKGLLEATERRLLDYIRREEELVKKLEELRG